MTRRSPIKTHEEFLELLVGKSITCLDEYAHPRTPMRFLCDVCAHQWAAQPASFLRGGFCPICANLHRGELYRAKHTNKILTHDSRGVLTLDISTPGLPGYEMLIDKKSWDLLHARHPAMGRVFAHKGKAGAIYARCKILKATRQIHSLILPEAPLIDHVNGDGLDNREANLRPCTHAQNAANRTQLAVTNTSGVAGVSWNIRAKRWVASLKHRGEYVYLGSYVDKSQAVTARKSAEKEYFKEFAPCS